MITIRKSLIAFACLGTLATGQVMAHTTVLKKNTPEGWAERIELEGTSTVSATTISHACSFEGSEPKKVTAQAVVWPNGENAVVVKIDPNTGEPSDEEVVLTEEIIGNAVMGPKPVQDYNIFKKIKTKIGDVTPYNNHGLRTTDIRAFHYTNGELETFLYGVVPYTAGYPKFRKDEELDDGTIVPGSCATKLKIQFAIANYCRHTKNEDKNDRADIWLGHLTSKFNDPDVVSVGFWPHVNVMRDMVKNPLPAHCNGEGYEIVVTPSDESIDEYLPIKSYWPANGRRSRDDD